MYFLLLADVVLSILFDIYTVAFGRESKHFLLTGIAVNVIDTLICWNFLGIVVTSLRFVGCLTILKKLIHLPRFLTLFLFLLLYIIGAVLELLIFFSISEGEMEIATEIEMEIATEIETEIVMEIAMELLNVFTKLALVGVLNFVQVQNVSRPPFNYRRLLKRSLVVTWFFQFCNLVGATYTLIVHLGFHESPAIRFKAPIMELLLLPFVTRTTELIWTKILQDDKCIIGKYESNSFTRYNPRISYTIEII